METRGRRCRTSSQTRNIIQAKAERERPGAAFWSAATSRLKSAFRTFPLVSNLYADSHLQLLQHNEMPKTVQMRKMRRDNCESQEQAKF